MGSYGHQAELKGRMAEEQAKDTEAHAAVERAYHEVLGRTPDQAGLRSFSERMIKENRDGNWVRDVLRNSPEGRKKSTLAHRKIKMTMIPAAIFAACPPTSAAELPTCSHSG